ncbi:MAG: hypothetical protein K1X83_08525 [Oligoflexia bacterium]|nr:hypothetical protein [Oligoflexia bacterium]
MLRAVFLTLLLLLCLAACSSAKAKIAPQAAQGTAGQIALMPIEAPADIARERVAYIREAILAELRNSGYAVLDDQLVQKLCTSSSCPERTRLATDYLVENFATLKLKSVDRNNFLAGYYNAISGNLSLVDSSGHELATVDLTESEKGGLIFNSGQLFQGIRSQAQNSAQESFANLADKFARSAVAKLPRPAAVKIGDDALGIDIQKIEVTPVEIPLYRLCAKATPRSMAYLVINKLKTNLRETAPGNYCGIYRLDGVSDTPAVELRSPFGNSVRRELEMKLLPRYCRLDGLVSLSSEGKFSSLLVGCKDSNDQRCQARLSGCNGSKFIVYRAPQIPGVFSKVAEFSGSGWREAFPAEKANYQIVAVSGSGLRSQPATPPTQ